MSNTKQVLTQKSARGIREISKLENVAEGYIIISDKQNVIQLMTEILTTEQAKDFIRDNRYRYQNCTFDFKYEVVETIEETVTKISSKIGVGVIPNGTTTNEILNIGTCYPLSKESFIKLAVEGFIFLDIFGNKLFYSSEMAYPFRQGKTLLNNFHQFDGNNLFRLVGNMMEQEEKKYKVSKGTVSFEVVTKDIDSLVCEMNLDKYELIGE